MVMTMADIEFKNDEELFGDILRLLDNEYIEGSYNKECIDKIIATVRKHDSPRHMANIGGDDG